MRTAVTTKEVNVVAKAKIVTVAVRTSKVAKQRLTTKAKTKARAKAKIEAKVADATARIATARIVVAIASRVVRTHKRDKQNPHRP